MTYYIIGITSLKIFSLQLVTTLRYTCNTHDLSFSTVKMAGMDSMEGYFDRHRRYNQYEQNEDYNWDLEHEEYFQRKGKFNLPLNSEKKIPSRSLIVKPPTQPQVESEDQGRPSLSSVCYDAI